MERAPGFRVIEGIGQREALIEIPPGELVGRADGPLMVAHALEQRRAAGLSGRAGRRLAAGGEHEGATGDAPDVQTRALHRHILN